VPITPDQVKAGRRLLRWTQAQLAVEANISPATVSQFEWSAYRPTQRMAAAIQQALWPRALRRDLRTQKEPHRPSASSNKGFVARLRHRRSSRGTPRNRARLRLGLPNARAGGGPQSRWEPVGQSKGYRSQPRLERPRPAAVSAASAKRPPGGPLSERNRCAVSSPC
jgi:transcriptional regulator with XRE-family HTH domain